MKQKAQGFISKEKVLAEEYDLVHQAVFVEPHDQSGWFYHLWLLDQTVAPDAPILISTWPVCGSDLIVSFHRNSDDTALPTFTTYQSASGTFPLILYFNQSVEGVSSSTVTVNFLFCMEDLIWRPLLSSNSKKARAWVTFLKFPDAEGKPAKTYSVKVSLGHSQGIISSSGSHYKFPTEIEFTVSQRHIESENADEGIDVKMLDWRDDSFNACKALPLDKSSILSFDRLGISKDHWPAASKWLIETMTKEIALFRELLLIENW